MEQVYSPGMHIAADVHIGGSRIRSPGRYQILARVFVDTKSHIESNTLQVEVLAPSAVDRQLIASLASEDAFVRLLREGPTSYCGDSSAQNCFERLDHALVQFPESAYAPSLTWDLAEAVTSGVLPVPSRYEVAVGLFRRFLERWPNHPSAPTVMARMAMVLDGAGRYAEARSTIQEFVTRFPEEKEKIESLRVNFRSGLQAP
jgi:hypothetical protein